jgi:hypothetical protein
MSIVLGSHSFLVTPTVNDLPMMLTDGTVPSFFAGATTDLPAAGTIGRIYLDTSKNIFFRDTGSSWVSILSTESLTGTDNQIAVQYGVISLASNPIIPGTGSFRPPIGTTAQRPSTPSAGDIRYNSSISRSEEFNGTNWQPAGGIVLQVKTGPIPISSGTVTVPLDNTVPLITEGNQIWSQIFTPLSVTSRVIITFTITHANSVTTSSNILSVFAGSTNIGCVTSRVPTTAQTGDVLSVSVVHTPGSTASITYSARLGGASGTAYCNQTGAATLGGALTTSYIITEIQ